MRKLLAGAGVLLASLTLAASAAADPAVHELPPDETFTDVNPCTGQTTTITFSYSKFVIREGPDAAGGFHVTGTGVGTVTTTDGFTGRFTFWFGFNGTRSGTTVETFTQSVTISNESRQRVVAIFVFHVTSVDGDVKAEIELDKIRCLGRPA